MTSKFLGMRLGAIVIGAVLCLSAVPAAFATEATGTQNPNLTVFVSLTSPDPLNPGVPRDVARVGDTVVVVLSVANNKGWTFPFRPEEVRLDLTLKLPNGDPLNVSTDIFLLPEQKVRVAFDYKVPEFIPKGPYELTLAATQVRNPGAGTSSAAATIEITF
jgi:hypothetical protein